LSVSMKNVCCLSVSVENVCFLRVSMEIVHSVHMESTFRTKSVSTNPHLRGTCVSKPLSSNGLFPVYSLQSNLVFGEPLKSNELLLWLNYSGFQESYHITFRI
jgi:hypothetical protein